MSFRPSCITRASPELTIGLPAMKSGVLHPQPNVPGTEGSMKPFPAPPLEAPYGLAMVGQLNRLKTSTRNWALNRSLNVKFLNIEKSTSLKPLSRNRFRPIVPKVPKVGGTMTELPETKQPALASVLGSGAFAMHGAAIEDGRLTVWP